MDRLILASGSPRRREILTAAGVAFTTAVSDADEKIRRGTLPADAALILACKKASAVASAYGGEEGVYVLGADTVVDFDGEIFGKPRGRAEAIRMISALSGRTHLVHTGICVVSGGRSAGFCETTRVTVDRISEEEIAAYADTAEPYDKAGGYAVQGRFAVYIRGIAGDYFNVMGLPVRALDRLLRREFGISLASFPAGEPSPRN